MTQKEKLQTELFSLRNEVLILRKNNRTDTPHFAELLERIEQIERQLVVINETN